MIAFDFQLRTRIVFGDGKLTELGALAAELGMTRVLVVSDCGVAGAGHTGRGVDSLRSAGVQAAVFTDIHENPTTADVDAALAAAREFQPDGIIGLGGGSSMDCAKGVNFVYTNGGRMQDYWGTGKATRPMLPMIGVPTTAGTGSETQSFALISDAETHVKMACGDKKATFRVALLDPTLTLTQPARVTALTGIDALSHALETYVTTRRNPASVAFSLEAWRLLARHFSRVLATPDDLEARSRMQLGASLAGVAIENSMLGATHALANPLTARFGLPHGEAIGLMLPHVIRFNGPRCDRWYGDLLELCRGADDPPDPAGGPAGLADFVAGLAAKAGLPCRLADRGVREDDLPALATDAAKQWTGTFNPRPVGASEWIELYRAAL